MRTAQAAAGVTWKTSGGGVCLTYSHLVIAFGPKRCQQVFDLIEQAVMLLKLNLWL